MMSRWIARNSAQFICNERNEQYVWEMVNKHNKQEDKTCRRNHNSTGKRHTFSSRQKMLKQRRFNVLLCFQHLSESCFWHEAVLRTSRKFAILCHYVRPFVVNTWASNVLFYALVLKTKFEYFHFPIVKMAAYYAEFGRVGKFESVFQQSSSCSCFLNFS